MRKRDTKTSGQSLIEVVVALGVVLFVLVSAVAVVVINIFGQRVSENKIIASNLAREGIEAFRNLRDSATLAHQTITDENATYVETTHCYTLSTFDLTKNRWNLAVSATDFGAETALWVTQNRYQADGSGVTATPFKRRIIVDPICVDTSQCGNGYCEPTSQPCTGNEGLCTAVKGYRVKSQVRWQENSKQQDFEVVNFLYNWK